MESLGILAGGVAHDMNNVLGAILVTASAHQDNQVEGSATHRAFGTILRAAERGGKLVKGLLTFSRQSPAEERDVDLNAVIREEVELLERTTLAQVRLVLDLDPDLASIRGDAGALTHAVMNLCVNAVDAMPANGTLTLRTRNLGGGWIQAQVQDEGCGMPPEVLAKALDPFYTTKKVGKGTGLGLSMVYNTVRAHHGELDLQSEPGHGTCVTMRFPATATAPAPEPAGEGLHGAAPGGLLVRVVDDDELMQSTLVPTLQGLGHRTASATCGESALAQIEEGTQPDVMILDLNMPGLGGAGTLAGLRTKRPSLPVLLVSGKVDQAALDLAGTDSRVALLPKPFTAQELERQLEAAVRS
jgi:CheY-like chemotaxis protein